MKSTENVVHLRNQALFFLWQLVIIFDYKEQNLADDSLSDDDLINAIVKTPKLLERPVVVNNTKAAIGRPPEAVLDII